MTSSAATTLGVSAGNGMIHCALVTTDDHGRLSADSRVIDVDPTDRLDRAGRVNSGIDLMLERARRIDSTVGAIGVACRTTRQGREIASRGVGPRRQIHLVGDAESVAHALAATGEIAQHSQVVVVDCGDTGMTMFRLDTASSRDQGDHIVDTVRSTAISGFALDAALADQVVADTTAMASRAGRAALVSGCRTAKEDLALGDSTIFQVGGVDRSMSVAMLEAAITPMATRAAGEISAYLADGPAGSPTPIVLVGGLANIPAVHQVLARDCGVDVIVPDSPELLCAIGAGLLARSTGSLPSRLAFIGGRRYRDLLSAVPLAVVGSLLAGTMLTVYAVGTALTGNATPENLDPATAESSVVETSSAPPGSEARFSTVATTGESTISRSGVTTTRSGPPSDRSPATVVTTPPITPSWATTELPTTMPSTRVATSTLTPDSGPTSPNPSEPDGSSTPDPSGPPTSPTKSLTPFPYESPVSSAPESPSDQPTTTTPPIG